MNGPRSIVPPASFIAPGLAPVTGAPLTLLINHGGPVLGSVEVVPIYWGADWSSGTNATLTTQLDGFFDFILTSSHMDLLREYGTATTPIGHGRRISSVHVSGSEPGTVTPTGRQVTDAQIKQAIQGWIADGTAPAITANTLYFVYLPPNVVSAGRQGVGKINSGDKIQLQTRTGFYINCHASQGSVQAIETHSDDPATSDEIFTIIKLGVGKINSGDKIQLQTRTGFYINCHASQGSVQAIETHSDDPATSDEIFTIIKLGGKGGQINGGDKIQLQTRTGFYINCHASQGSVQAIETHSDDPATSDEIFTIIKCEKSCEDFCGYHAHDGNLYYAVIPYVTCSGCVFPGNFLDTLTEVTSHELVEAITDPASNAWWDPNTGNEIGDLCNRITQRFGGYLIQTEWSNSQQACIIESRLVLLQTRTGFYINCHASQGSVQAIETHSDDPATSDEIFTIIKLGGGQINSGDKIQLQTRTGFYINCHASQGSVQAIETHSDDPATSDEIFTIIKLGGGQINSGDKIQLQTRTGFYINCHASQGSVQAIDTHSDDLATSDEIFTIIFK